MAKKLKVFQGTVNYGTQAGLFAQELRNQGVKAISVVSRDWAKRQTDVELLSGGNYVQRLVKFFENHLYLFYCFFKYNTFHFYFGRTLFKKQIDLPFYKFFGKKVIIEYLGDDIRHYKTLVDRYNLPEDHRYYKEMGEHDRRIAKRVKNEKKYIDYKLCCAPSHMDFAKSYGYQINEIVPLALDISKINYTPLTYKDRKEPLTILHAPTNRKFKGTDYIEEAINQLTNEGYNIYFKVVRGVTHSELLKEYELCDIFIDQISVGWYGTAALEAMAFGRPTCAFMDQRYFQYIDYSDEIPIVNINRENVTYKIRELVENRADLPEIGVKSREFVENYHNVVNLTKKLIDIYQNKVWK
jgi:glycosyltransferase involved in cell wall biosynthesis